MKLALALGLALLIALAGAGVLYTELATATRAEGAASQRAQAAQAALKQAQAAAALGDQLTQRLAHAEQALATTRTERDDAILKATTGRTCLRAAALRVLDGAPGLRVAVVPAAAGSAAAAHRPLAADTGNAGRASPEPEAGPDGHHTTDTQLSRWMLSAGAQFESCRARLDALIDYTIGLARIPAQPSPGAPAAGAATATAAP